MVVSKEIEDAAITTEKDLKIKVKIIKKNWCNQIHVKTKKNISHRPIFDISWHINNDWTFLLFHQILCNDFHL